MAEDNRKGTLVWGQASCVSCTWRAAQQALLLRRRWREASPAFNTRRRRVQAIAILVRRWSITAFRQTRYGALKRVSRVDLEAETPCHIAVHPSGRHLLSAGYHAGTVTVHALGADGRIQFCTDRLSLSGSGPDPTRQEAPHVHQVVPTRDGRYVLVVDLGTDRILTYGFDTADGRLEFVHAARATPGSGPRHLAFGPGNKVYVAGELDSSVSVFGFDVVGGKLEPLSRANGSLGMVPSGLRNFPSEIVISRDGRHLYLANRGLDVVTVPIVDGHRVTPLGDVSAGGSWPRHIAIVGDVLFVANERSDTVSVLRRDPATGHLRPTGAPATIAGPTWILADRTRRRPVVEVAAGRTGRSGHVRDG